jgi:hypothetical protein
MAIFFFPQLTVWLRQQKTHVNVCIEVDNKTYLKIMGEALRVCRYKYGDGTNFVILLI